MRGRCFQENERFFVKTWALEQCFLENGRSVDKIWDENCDFFLKNRKKEYPIDVFTPLYCVILTEFTFFGTNMGMTDGGFS